jgi:hypothetical protein
MYMYMYIHKCIRLNDDDAYVGDELRLFLDEMFFKGIVIYIYIYIYIYVYIYVYMCVNLYIYIHVYIYIYVYVYVYT